MSEIPENPILYVSRESRDDDYGPDACWYVVFWDHKEVRKFKHQREAEKFLSDLKLRLVDKERRSFEYAIRDKPNDRSTRLVYSDWLEEHDEPELADHQRRWTEEYQEAEEWLVEFAYEFGMSYEGLLMAAEEYLGIGAIHCLPFDTPDRAFISSEVERFWNAYQTVTNIHVPEESSAGLFFRCAC